jgi:hypothetical protein
MKNRKKSRMKRRRYKNTRKNKKRIQNYGKNPQFLYHIFGRILDSKRRKFLSQTSQKPTLARVNTMIYFAKDERENTLFLWWNALYLW